MYVYVASSWRNPRQPEVIERLRSEGIDCYDFRNPKEGSVGFSWRETKAEGSSESMSVVEGVKVKGSDWESAADYQQMLTHPRAIEGFGNDWNAMQRADAFLMILPCGKSAHLEMGWAVGAGKPSVILLEDPVEPELMYKMVDYYTADIDFAVACIKGFGLITGTHPWGKS